MYSVVLTFSHYQQLPPFRIDMSIIVACWILVPDTNRRPELLCMDSDNRINVANIRSATIMLDVRCDAFSTRLTVVLFSYILLCSLASTILRIYLLGYLGLFALGIGVEKRVRPQQGIFQERTSCSSGQAGVEEGTCAQCASCLAFTCSLLLASVQPLSPARSVPSYLLPSSSSQMRSL